jgi:hypothetical protein
MILIDQDSEEGGVTKSVLAWYCHEACRKGGERACMRHFAAAPCDRWTRTLQASRIRRNEAIKWGKHATRPVGPQCPFQWPRSCATIRHKDIEELSIACVNNNNEVRTFTTFNCIHPCTAISVYDGALVRTVWCPCIAWSTTQSMYLAIVLTNYIIVTII